MPEEHDLVSMGVAAALARELASDAKEFVPGLCRVLQQGLPESTEVILSGGFLSRKTVSGVRVSLGDFQYEIDSGAKGQIRATRTHVVRGISLKSEPLDIETWIEEVGAAIEERMRSNARTKAALSGLLNL
ncbi:hypothetical protein [Fimbriimonas ginsengisoli]|uniref:Uncharacterized protein n=1 Tax=Fimbriimonas ginsengisoli Gsoil 348 TaxID=661478 RepID=A0A068NYT3_FIMGI|nr:hypothetical protein [Fimbriimonas ginsengisoli]AIE87374.1 hypothetical protein OP10G_4006 [Fimbriimonas ginsengisoli Gsoil 348]